MIRKNVVIAGAAALAVSLCGISATHAEGPKLKTIRSIALTVENDYFAGTDRNYTQGLRLSLTSLPVLDSEMDGVARFVSKKLLRAKPGEELRKEIAIGQSIFTPEDRLATEPLPDQHPYAGWLYLEASAFLLRPERAIFDTLTVQAGIVGPAAGGEWVQNNFHSLIGDDELLGWDNQLENEPGIAISFNRKHRILLVGDDSGGLNLDFIPSYGATVGNIRTQANIGGLFRLGWGLRETFGPPRVRPALGGTAVFESDAKFSGYLFLGTEGRAVAQNIFLDGNTWRESLSVDKKPLVADFQLGLVFQYEDWLLSWSMVARTEEFKTQTERQRFGAISIVRRF